MFVASGAIGGPRVSVAHTHLAASDADQSSYTFSGVNFGLVSPRRHIIVGFECFAIGTNFDAPHAMTIGGIAATRAVTNALTGLTAFIQLWIAPVPAGASGAIVVSRPGTMGGGAIGVWAAYNLKSAAPHDTAVTALDLDTLGGGLAIGYARVVGAGTFTWSGLTEDFDAGADTGARHSGASFLTNQTETPRAISVTASAGTPFRVAASWR